LIGFHIGFVVKCEEEALANGIVGIGGFNCFEKKFFKFNVLIEKRVYWLCIGKKIRHWCRIWARNLAQACRNV
jgi:hypothetical protein